MKRRILSICLVLAMVLSLVPMVASAATELSFSKSLTLSDGIAVNFKLDQAALDAVDFDYVLFECNGAQQKITEKPAVNADGKYVFTFANLGPHMMAETITAKVYLKDGSCELEEEYSILEYCQNKMAAADTSFDLKILLANMLQYGASAQAYMGDSGNAFNSLTADQKAYATNGAPALENIKDLGTQTGKAVVWQKVGLYLADTVAVRFMFSAASVDGLSVKVNGTACEFVEVPEEKKPAGVTDPCYYVYYNGLNPSQMRDKVEATVYNASSQAVSTTAVYSIESYAYNMKDNSTVGDLVKAMIKYGDAVYDYVDTESLVYPIEGLTTDTQNENWTYNSGGILGGSNGSVFACTLGSHKDLGRGYYKHGSNWQDYTISTDITLSKNVLYYGLRFRFDSATNSGYELKMQDGKAYVYEYSNNAIASTLANGVSFTTGEKVSVSISAIGTTVKVFVNDTCVLNTTEAKALTGTVGFIIKGNETAQAVYYLSNFVVRTKLIVEGGESGGGESGDDAMKDWVVEVGDWSLVNDALVFNREPDNTAINRVYYAPSENLGDFELSVDMTAPTAAGQNVKIMFRSDTAGKSFYAFTFLNGSVYLEVWVNGSRPVQSQRTGFVYGDTYHVEISMEGDLLYAYMTGSDTVKKTLWNGYSSGARTEHASGMVGFSVQNVSFQAENLEITDLNNNTGGGDTETVIYAQDDFVQSDWTASTGVIAKDSTTGKIWFRNANSSSSAVLTYKNGYEWTDYELSMDVELQNDLAEHNTQFGVYLRYQDSSNNIYLLFDAGKIYARSYSGGTATDFSGGFKAAYTAGQPFNLRVSAIGTEVKVYVNDTLICSTDSAVDVAGTLRLLLKPHSSTNQFGYITNLKIVDKSQSG